MKLKRLLGGVTAAIMALSSVAIASFSSASAADDPYVYMWWQGYGTEATTSKTIAQGVADAEMAGATQAKVTWIMPDGTYFNEQTKLQISFKAGWDEGTQTFVGEGWMENGGTFDATVDLKTTLAEGNGYILKAYSESWEQRTTEDMWTWGFTKVEFLDAEGNVLKTQTEVGEEPVTDPPPAGQLPVRLVNNGGSDLAEPVVVTKDGQYEIESTEEFSVEPTDGSVGLYCSYAGLVANPETTTISIDKLEVNGSEVMLSNAWTDKKAIVSNALAVYPINSYDDSGSCYVPSEPVTSIKITFTIKNSQLGEYTPPVTQAPVKAETIESIQYNVTVNEFGEASQIGFQAAAASSEGWATFSNSVDITDATDYSIKLENINKTKMSNFGYYFEDGDVNQKEGTGSTVITVNTIVINDKYTFTVNRRLTTTGINADGVAEAGLNGIANVWNDDGRAEVVPYTCPDAYLAGSSDDSVGIRLVLGTPPTIDPVDPNPTNPTPSDSYEAYLMFCDKGYGWQNWVPNSQQSITEKDDGSVAKDGFGKDAAITGNGTYTVGVSPDCAQWENAEPTGIITMCADIVGYAKAIGASTEGIQGVTPVQAKEIAQKAGLSITNVTVLLDGNEYYKYDDANVLFGDIEGKGTLRIEIYNDYGSTKDTAPQEIKDLAAGGILGTKDSVELQFTLTYNKPATPTQPSGNNGGNTVNKATTAPTAKVTPVAPKTTSKSQATKAMKKAKIKKVTLKSKGKKITVKWKKVSKANGYQVQVSANKKFKKVIVNKKSVKKTNVTIKSKKLKKGKTYYVRVRAFANYGKSGKANSAWKKLGKVKFK